MAYLKNQWYVAALSSEIEGKLLFPRMICGEPIVFFRCTDGVVIALEDRCCHRSYPLHKGTIECDAVRCGYHGFVFGRDGRCVEIPGTSRIPSSARVKSYPIVERWGWVWIWIGEIALADPDDIADFHWLDDPDWGAKSTRYHVNAHYQLIIENLLDLTHLTFVHGSTIGNKAVIDNATVKFERGDYETKVTRWMMDIPPPPSYVKAGRFEGNIDRWMVVHYMPPGFCRLYTGGAPTGQGVRDGKPCRRMDWRNLNAVTPETETTTHYFWGQAHGHDVGNLEMTEMIFSQVGHAFLEDKAVFEAQQKNLDLFRDKDCSEICVRADTAAVHSRRIIERLFSEQANDPRRKLTLGEFKLGPEFS